jgi:hypothetical protein
LGGHQSEDGSRVFVDHDFVEAARGGALCRIIENPFVLEFDSENWQSVVYPLAARVAGHRAEEAGFAAGKVCAALLKMQQDRAYTLAADLCLVLLEMSARFVAGRPGAFLKEVVIPELVFDDLDGDIRHAEFQDSVVGNLHIASDYPNSQIPRFVRTYFGEVSGRTGIRDMPADRFIECTFDAFEPAARTTSAILGMTAPLGTKVVLTILKKLYAQSGSGRKESALFRGLDTRAQGLVPAALTLLRRHGLAVQSRHGSQAIWLPTRSGDARKRALSMLAAPHTSGDRVLKESQDLH